MTTRARSVRAEADALLTVLAMAERHHKWPLMLDLLAYIREAGGKVRYLDPGSYALEVPLAGPLRYP